MSRLNSYVPEIRFMEGKDQAHARLCQEDCALIDPMSQYRAVAARGREVLIGKPWAPLCGLPAEEEAFLSRALRDQKRFVLLGNAGAVLIFADWFPETGLLFAICPHCEPLSVCRALRLLGKREFAFSPACLSVSDEPRHSDAEAYRLLDEQLYYLERIFAPVNAPPLWTRTQLIANFVGCRVECDSLCAALPALLKTDEIRLCAMLVCLLLSARADGRVQTRAEEQDDRKLSFLAEVCGVHKSLHRDARFDFLHLPAFEDFGLQETTDGWLLQTNLHRLEDGIGVLASRPSLFGLHLLLRIAG